MELKDKVTFTEYANVEKLNIEVPVKLEGFITGYRVVPTSSGVKTLYLVSDVYPQAYRTPSDYGWYDEDELELL